MPRINQLDYDNLNIGGTYRVDGTQVVSNRLTGWGAPTGTPSTSWWPRRCSGRSP